MYVDQHDYKTKTPPLEHPAQRKSFRNIARNFVLIRSRKYGLEHVNTSCMTPRIISFDRPEMMVGNAILNSAKNRMAERSVRKISKP